MGGQQSIRQEFESQRLQEALAGRTFVKLPPREHKTSVSSMSEEGCYMDMSVCPYEIKKMVAESVEHETRQVLSCDDSVAVEESKVCAGVEEGISHENVEKPFDNLLDFTLHTEDSNANKCTPLFMDQPSIIAQ